MKKLFLMSRFDVFFTLAFLTSTAYGSQIVNPATGGGGGGSPGGTNYNVQVSSAGSFAGVSYFNAYASSAAIAGILDMKSNTIVNVADGVNTGDGVNFAQLSNIANANVLINGNFEFWQRNGIGGLCGADNQYCADRWVCRYSPGTGAGFGWGNTTGNLDATGGPYVADINVSNSHTDSRLWFEQRVENYQNYWGVTITFRARVKANMTGFKVFIDDGVTASTGTAHTGGGAYETLTVTKTISTSATKLYIQMGWKDAMQAVGGATHSYMATAMVVPGSEAIPFVARPYAQELSMAQRYFESSYTPNVTPGSVVQPPAFIANQFNTNSMQGYIQFRAIKAVIPTVTFYIQAGTLGQWNWTNTSGGTTARSESAINTTTQGFAFRNTSAVEYVGEGHWVADGELY